MRLSVLLLLLLLSLVPSSGERCKRDVQKYDYNAFSAKHILPKKFDVDCDKDWKKLLQKKMQYLNKTILCGRVPVQTFFKNADEMYVENICNRGGFEVNGPGNLCTSERKFTIYMVTSEKVKSDCKIKKKEKVEMYVTVGCEKLKKKCLPVHFHNQSNEEPNRNNPRCKLPYVSPYHTNNSL